MTAVEREPERAATPGRPSPRSRGLTTVALRWLRRSEGLSTRDAATRYVLALGLSLAGVAAKAVVDANLGSSTGYLAYVGAVVIAAWLGGLGGGIIATLVSATAQLLIFYVPAGPLGLTQAVAIAWFTLDGLLLSVVTSGFRRISVVERVGRRDATDLLAAVSRFKTAVDGSPDAVLMFDPLDLRVTYANRGAGALIGAAPDVWLEHPVIERQPLLSEATFREELRPLIEGRADAVRYAGVVGRTDGREVPVEAVVQRVLLPDGTTTMVLSAHDISERIEVQARLARVAGDERRQAAELRAVLEAMGEGVLVVDPGGLVRIANAVAREMLGKVPGAYADVPELLGLEAGDLPAPGQSAEPRVAHSRDGRWFEIATYVVESVAAASMPNGSTILALRDVTRARDAQQAREAFIGVLSHELRTPVTTIYGYAKVLRRPSHAAAQAEMLSDIELESDRLYRIVEDLLALSRVEGGLTIEAEPLLLQHVADPLLQSEAHRWPAVRFEADLPRDLPAVFGERTYVEQVLRNLLSNAAKYSPTDSTVMLAAVATPTEVEVRVLDRGVGITGDESDRLFQLYYRSPRTARTASGAGIGLFVSRGLVTAMGGSMWARPRAGGGSEFGFSLRRCDEDPVASSAA